MLLHCLFTLLFWLSGCSQLDESAPDALPAEVEPTRTAVVPMIREASGIADSKTLPGHLWVQEDSGNPPQLYLLGHDGKVFKTIYLKGAKNRDWEDLALAGDQLYLADIGDNNHVATEYTIYRFKEPQPATDTVRSFTTIRFRYPDGPHDAEAFLVDPNTKDILLLTKQDSLSSVYKLKHPYSTTATNVAQRVGTLPYPFVVSAAVSPNGKEAIVKTYSALYLYRQKANETLEEFLLQDFQPLPYRIEPQGEAVTFAATGAGYFTLSEKGLASAVHLYFYQR
ncbi:hypothetical protein [Rufibacter psychrotolerans]|uniref:hypothetical protein n=1 Tax=Rufibacter psychrotolerans TaxID=2812556 RepID=UPI0019682C86|nr:hypothetical protein [Rufibacter sp. SYSU D00308]